MVLARTHYPGATVLAAAVCVAGCSELYGGSKMELLLRAGVQMPGADTSFGRPPLDTHFEIWGVRDGVAFPLAAFELRPIVEADDPCLIEDPPGYVPFSDKRVVGLHSTRIYDKLLEIYRDPDSEGGPDITDNEAGALYDAQKRVGDIGLLAREVAVTSHEDGLTDGERAEAFASIPSPAAIDEETNQARYDACRELFRAHPGVYVGTDLMVGLSRNGRLFGVVEGSDPRTGSPNGGASFDLPAALEHIDVLAINWQYNLPRDECTAPPCPWDDRGYSAAGYHYMAGTPVHVTRGAISFFMHNNVFSNIAGVAAIYTGLNRDEVQF